MRHTGCKRAECFTWNHHVRDLSQELETTPPPKKNTRPPAPPDNTISFLSLEFQQAFLDNNLDEIQILFNQFGIYHKTSLDLLEYDCTKLTKDVKTARKLIKPMSKLPPAPTTQPLLHRSNPQYEDAQGWIHQMDWVKLYFYTGNASNVPIDKQSSFAHIDKN